MQIDSVNEQYNLLRKLLIPCKSEKRLSGLLSLLLFTVIQCPTWMPFVIKINYIRWSKNTIKYATVTRYVIKIIYRIKNLCDVHTHTHTHT